jgi:ribokinase
MRFAVLGHVEWVDFVRVDRLPRPGEILHAQEAWAEPAGGGAVAAVELARLAGDCTLLTALGDDRYGELSRAGLERLGVTVEASVRAEPQRRAVTFVDATGERAITLLGPKLAPVRADSLPWERLAGMDGVYFTAGDAEAVRAARAARVLVASARELPTLVEAGVLLDALVRSGRDPGEVYRPGDLDPPPPLAVSTEGAAGGTYGTSARYAAVEPPGPLVDMYGSGDSFAAGLTYALAQGSSTEEALAFAAQRGAEAVTRTGAHGG